MKYISYLMAASGRWMSLSLQCFLHGLTKLRSTETAKSARSSMTSGVIHSLHRTPPSVGRKFPRRNSAICLWKLSKPRTSNCPSTYKPFSEAIGYRFLKNSQKFLSPPTTEQRKKELTDFLKNQLALCFILLIIQIMLPFCCHCKAKSRLLRLYSRESDFVKSLPLAIEIRTPDTSGDSVFQVLQIIRIHSCGTRIMMKI